MLFGTGLAFFFGKPFIQPSAPRLPSIPFGWWSDTPQVAGGAQHQRAVPGRRRRLPSFLWWAFKNTRCGPRCVRVDRRQLRCGARHGLLGPTGPAARHHGGRLPGRRSAAPILSLYYPGSWSEGLSSGQGLMAVALVIFARWNPLGCFAAALLFGGAGALGPALQSVGVTQGYYLFYAAPLHPHPPDHDHSTSSPGRSLAGAPGELSITK